MFSMQSTVSTPWKHAEGMSLRYGAVIFGDLTHPQFHIFEKNLVSLYDIHYTN